MYETGYRIGLGMGCLSSLIGAGTIAYLLFWVIDAPWYMDIVNVVMLVYLFWAFGSVVLNLLFEEVEP
jgi:hypothetical protein